MLNILVATLLTLLCYYLCKVFQSGPHNFPPGPPTIPIIGNLEIIELYSNKFLEFAKTCGPIFSMQFFGSRFIVLNNWKVVKEALIGQSEIFSGRANSFTVNEVGQKNDIVALVGPLMKEKRRMAVQFLRKVGFDKTSMELVISDEVAKVLEIIDAKKEKPVEMKHFFFKPLLNILWSVMTGYTYEYDDPEIIKIIDLMKNHLKAMANAMVIDQFHILRFLPGDPFEYKKLLRLTKEIHKHLEKEIEEHRVSFDAESEPTNFIDAYLAEIDKKKDTLGKGNNHPYQIKHLVGAVFDIQMAGLETSKSTLEWSLIYMAKWPHIQQKVQNELESVIGRGRLPNYSDITHLPYTEATMLEIHRFASVVPLSIPHSTTANTKLAGYDIPIGTVCFPNIHAVHYEKELWGDPDVFRPERFIKSDGKVEKPEYLIPFSIGTNLKVLRKLMANGDFKLVPALFRRL